MENELKKKRNKIKIKALHIGEKRKKRRRTIQWQWRKQCISVFYFGTALLCDHERDERLPSWILHAALKRHKLIHTCKKKWNTYVETICEFTKSTTSQSALHTLKVGNVLAYYQLPDQQHSGTNDGGQTHIHRGAILLKWPIVVAKTTIDISTIVH